MPPVGLSAVGHVAEGERQTEGEPVVEHVHGDAGLEAAGGDHQDAGDQAEGEAVEEDRRALAEPWASAKMSAGHHDGERRATQRSAQAAEGLRQVAAEGVLLAGGLERASAAAIDEQEVARGRR